MRVGVFQIERKRASRHHSRITKTGSIVQLFVGHYTSEYLRQLRRAAADLKSKEFESSLENEAFLERYRLAAIEQEIAAVSSKAK